MKKINLLFVILVISFSGYLSASPFIKTIEFARNYVTVEFTPSFTDTSAVNIDGNLYRNIRLFEGQTDVFRNLNAAPVSLAVLLFSVPSVNGNTFEILETEFFSLTGGLAPVPDDKKFLLATETDRLSSSENPVTFGKSGLIREYPVQEFLVSTVFPNNSNTSLKLLKRIRIKVYFNPEGLARTDISSLETQFTQCFAVPDRYFVEKKSAGAAKKLMGNSVLAAGKWVRFEAPKEGIYKIGKETLASLGIDASVDPRTIKIYNNGGIDLPENPEAVRPVDLQEIAVYSSGEADGKFDATDYILFYGRGIDFWYYNQAYGRVSRNASPYRKENYYWITSGGSFGKRMIEKPSENSPGATVVTSSNAYAGLEDEKINVGKTGRNFVGDEFSQSVKSRSYATKLDGIINSSPVNYTGQFVNASSGTIQYSIFESTTELISSFAAGYNNEPYVYGVTTPFSGSLTGAVQSGRSLLKITVNGVTSTSFMYLDYFEIEYKRDLMAVNDYLVFYSPQVNNLFEYTVSNFSNSNIFVFDVSDNDEVQIITSPLMVSGGQFKFQSTNPAGMASKFIAVTPSAFLSPANPVVVANQNLRGNSIGAKFIIVAPREFKTDAERLKQYRETNNRNKMTTQVALLDEIYNEFSGGSLDVGAIRDYISYAFRNWTIKPEYVLLFGDGDYDYKNIEGQNNNKVPAYETTEFLKEIYSYASDDYYSRIVGNDDFVDIAVGRIPAQSVSEAASAVDKIIDYEQNEEKGLWRNRITLVADDGYTSYGTDFDIHTTQSETLSSSYIPVSFDQKKIYLSEYPTQLTSLGKRKPAVNQAIVDAINDGTFVLNYIGHGSPELWAHEQVFVKSTTVPQLTNSNYFFLTAATCDFAYYDRTNGKSAGEELLMKKKSGAIAVFASCRPVYALDNAALNETFYSKIFNTPRDSSGLMKPLGTFYYYTKMLRSSTNDLKFHLLGDPSIRLNAPPVNGVVDSINGYETVSRITQVKALSRIILKGTIRKRDGSIDRSFNGEGVLTVYDSDRYIPLPEFGSYTYTASGGILFRGRIPVSAGTYQADFVTPADISYENRRGKIVFYYYNDAGDGLAYTKNLTVGGTDTVLKNDGKGPSLEVFFDDDSYSPGRLASPNSLLIIRLNDETGLNTTGTGIGHKMEGVLNGKENEPIDFNQFFTSDLNTGGRSGAIRYKLPSLQAGDYSLQIKAWDVFNNLTKETASFRVVNSTGLVIDYVYNYPNPFSGSTTFTLEHTVSQPVDCTVKIFSVAGRLLHKLERRGLTEKFVKIPWDGRDAEGNLLANGTYLYKVILRISAGSEQKEVLGKFSIIR